jgi:hypothetical protein
MRILFYFFFALSLAACSLNARGQYTQSIDSPTQIQNQSVMVYSTITPSAVVTPTPISTQAPTVTPIPTMSCLIDGTIFTEANHNSDGSYMFPVEISKIDKPLDQWTEAEKVQIVDAAGNPIYDGVRTIVNSRWVSENMLKYVATWEGKGCGFGLMFTNQNDDFVWATNILGNPMDRPDGNGVGFGVQIIPNPGIEGHLELIVGKEQIVVWIGGADQIIRMYDPMTQTWELSPGTPVPAPYELTSEQLVEKQLYGSGFEIVSQYRGMQVDFTFVTSDAQLKLYGVSRGCMINQELGKWGASAEERIAKAVYLGHYLGYLRYKGLREPQFSFDEYMSVMISGQNMSYSLYGVRIGQEDGEFMVDPNKPVEFIITDGSIDDPNGRGTARGAPGSTMGYIQLENGGMRIVIGFQYKYKSILILCTEESNDIGNMLMDLGVFSEFLTGKIQIVSFRSYYPNTDKEMGNTLSDRNTCSGQELTYEAWSKCELLTSP